MKDNSGGRPPLCLGAALVVLVPQTVGEDGTARGAGFAHSVGERALPGGVRQCVVPLHPRPQTTDGVPAVPVGVHDLRASAVAAVGPPSR
ncbi:hypothetical protein [Streptomyces longwoodensis]|uniref:hypothetical protein n=1 Tax=Streptomyces longwoodensis TaxID=68231 RepID=UPI003850599C